MLRSRCPSARRRRSPARRPSRPTSSSSSCGRARSSTSPARTATLVGLRRRPRRACSRRNESCRCASCTADSRGGAFRRDRARRGARRRRRPAAPAAAAPAARRRDGAPHGRRERAPPVAVDHGYCAVEPVLIYNSDGFKPAELGRSRRRDRRLRRRHRPRAGDRRRAHAHPEVAWEPVDAPVGRRADRAGVATARSSYAIVASLDAPPSRATSTSTSTSRFRSAASASSRGRSRRAFAKLRDELDRFLARCEARRDARSASPSATSPSARQFQRIDAGVLQERIAHAAAAIPADSSSDAQAQTGIEWRLLAAIAYQESQWDPSAHQRDRRARLHADHRGHGAPPRRRRPARPRAERPRRRALPARPQGQAAGAHPRARPHVARARRVQHRPRPPRGRAHPRAEAEAQSGPVERREEGAAAARAARILRAGEARLRARRHAGRVRRPRARLLRRPARAGAAVPAAAARCSPIVDPADAAGGRCDGQRDASRKIGRGAPSP